MNVLLPISLVLHAFGSETSASDSESIWYQQAMKEYKGEMDKLEELATDEFFENALKIANEWEKAGIDAAKDMWDHGFANAWMGSAQATGAACEIGSVAAGLCGKKGLAKGLKVVGVSLDAAGSIGQFVTSITEKEVFQRKFNKYVEATKKYDSNQYQKIHYSLEKLKLIRDACVDRPRFKQLEQLKPSAIDKIAAQAPAGMQALFSMARVAKQIKKFEKKTYKKPNGTSTKPKSWMKMRKAGQLLAAGLNGAAGILCVLQSVEGCKSAEAMMANVIKDARAIRKEAQQTKALVKVFKHLFSQAQEPADVVENDPVMEELLSQVQLTADDYESDD